MEELANSLKHWVRSVQNAKEWVLVANWQQERLFFNKCDDKDTAKSIKKPKNKVVIGAIVLKDDWVSTKDILHGEGVFIDLDNYTIIQTGYVVTVIKSSGNLLKLAKGIGQQYIWEPAVEKIKELISESEELVFNQ